MSEVPEVVQESRVFFVIEVAFDQVKDFEGFLVLARTEHIGEV
jgi:hypothetical protein